ncbi:DUF2946 domain-containing protein [Acetobacter sp.]|uniref:DUF2946 domain-containing protein n=1 Tax=Acetobacter sp. TaxID=440 RepID=UPI0039E98FCF
MSNASTMKAVIARWLVVLFTLFGFLGLLGLQTLSAPQETPRAAILRLTGIDIQPSNSVQAVASHTEMPSMQMDGMEMTAHQHGHMVRQIANTGKAPLHQSPHQHGADCPLCPLLIVFGVLLATAVFLPAVSSMTLIMRRFAVQPRAPPAVMLAIPPATGPPFLI